MASTQAHSSHAPVTEPLPLRSKRDQAQAILLSRIREQGIMPGEHIPSEAALVAELGISRATVRRAIRGLVRKGVIESRAGVGHVVRSAQPRTRIALLYGKHVFQPGGAPFDQLMMTACRRELQRRQCEVITYMTRIEDAAHMGDRERLIRDVHKGLIRGVLVVGWPCPQIDDPVVARMDADLRDALQAQGIPWAGATDEDVPGAVNCDYQALGLLGAAYFVEHRAQRIGLIIAGEDPDSDERVLAGYRQALERAGAPFRPECLCRAGGMGETAGYHAFKAWWPTAGEPDAIVVEDDFLFRGALFAALDLGIAIPDRLRFASLSIKGSPMFFPRPFVRLEIDPEQIGRLAVDILLSMVRNPDEKIAAVAIEPRVIPPDSWGPGSPAAFPASVAACLEQPHVSKRGT